MIRLYAEVNYIGERKELHTMGANDVQELLPIPHILILEEEKDGGGFTLHRYTDEGEFCGETWHQRLEEAKHQAHFEYDGGISEWRDVPEDIADLETYVVNYFEKN